MATRKDPEHTEEGDVIHAADVSDDQARRSPVPADDPRKRRVVDDDSNAEAVALVEAARNAGVSEDPEIAERQQRIADLERQVAEAERTERRRLVDADRQFLIDNLDDREAELRAQLARVRGDSAEEPHEENR